MTTLPLYVEVCDNNINIQRIIVLSTSFGFWGPRNGVFLRKTQHTFSLRSQYFLYSLISRPICEKVKMYAFYPLSKNRLLVYYRQLLSSCLLENRDTDLIFKYIFCFFKQIRQPIFSFILLASFVVMGL